jgi:hypothetical protein
MIRVARGAISGVNLEVFRTGSMYDVPRSLGDYLIGSATAEFVASDAPALLIPCVAPQPSVFLHDEAGAHEQRGAGESMFTYEPAHDD